MSVLVTKEAPDFVAPAVMPDGSIKDEFKLSDLRGKYVVLFFYPLDFTFVCPTEIIAHDKRVDEFKQRGVEVVGVSIDSQFTHYAWRNTSPEDGGIGQVQFLGSTAHERVVLSWSRVSVDVCRTSRIGAPTHRANMRKPPPLMRDHQRLRG